jgi:HAD superfamily phosphoserine phosphatase-like hydrolase
MKILYALIIATIITSCNGFGKNYKKVNTVVFDFDATILKSDRAITMNMLKYGNSKFKDKEKTMQYVDYVIDEYRNAGDKSPLYTMINSLEDLGIKVTKQTNNELAKDMTRSYIMDDFSNIIKTLHKNNIEVFVIGGGYSSCEIMVNILSKYDIPASNIFSGRTRYNKNGVLYLDKKDLGFVNCKTNSIIEPLNWNKSNVIRYIKDKRKDVDGIVHVGDGMNDLEVYKEKSVDHFIGFGVYNINKDVEKNSPIFVYNVNDFKSKISQLTGVNLK